MVNKLFHSKLLRKVYPNALWQMDGNSPVVYLTFDDGPHPEITPWVLAQLKEFNAKATFFCIGDNVVKHQQTYQQILMDQHQVGNHTMHHLNGWKTNSAQYADDISQCARLVQSILFRPPYGRMKKRQYSDVQARGFKVVMWSLLSRDYDRNLNKEESLKHLMSSTENGSIVVFHDSVKAEKNLKFILPGYLNFLKARGYQLKAIAP